MLTGLTGLAYTLFILQLVSAERIVFDALGQMWVILFANGITIIATLVCILGVLCKKNAAILAVNLTCMDTYKYRIGNIGS